MAEIAGVGDGGADAVDVDQDGEDGEAFGEVEGGQFLFHFVNDSGGDGLSGEFDLTGVEQVCFGLNEVVNLTAFFSQLRFLEVGVVGDDIGGINMQFFPDKCAIV